MITLSHNGRHFQPARFFVTKTIAETFSDTGLKTDRPNFQLVSNGRTERKAGGWVVKSRVPDFDIDPVLADGLSIKSYKQGIYNLQLVSKGMPDEASTTLLAGIKEILDFPARSQNAFY